MSSVQSVKPACPVEPGTLWVFNWGVKENFCNYECARPARTSPHMKNLNSNGLFGKVSIAEAIRLTEPIGYISFMNLVFNSKFVVTDSGGIQEETTYLGIPCFTLRNNTERPLTITQGTNRLCNPDNLFSEVKKCLDGGGKTRNIPYMWDGNTAQRVTQSIRNLLTKQA